MKIGEQNSMNHRTKSKKKKRFKNILLWSLLIHLLILIIFLIFAFKKTKFLIPKNLISKKTAKQKGDALASLKPKKSTFGTTVMFDDTPQFKPPEAKLMAQQDLKEIKAPEDVVQQEQKKQEPIKKEEPKKLIKQKPKEIKPIKREEPKIKIAKAETIPEIKKEEVIEKKEEEKPKKEELPPKKEQIKQEEIQRRLEEIEKKQQLLAKQPEAQQVKTIGEAQKDAVPKRKKSIVALTKGFIENLEHKGDDWLERKGDDSKRPSLEELKYLSYEHEIQWQLQNSWKLNFERSATNQNLLHGMLVVYFKINEDGDLLETTILQTSGITQLDKLVVKSIKLAAPFPPLPKHFNKKIYETGRRFYVNMHNVNF